MEYGNGNWLLRGCSKADLARAYSPDVGDRAARHNLSLWISMYPGLLPRLQATGWNKRMKLLTPNQVRLIVEALGEPG
ncbi:MAG: DUF4248 domain-containing protein [Prevotellaceae bacterium]|nr:DUF4248 domain-containing protein [Prevotellaceae bacterium]